MREKIRLDLLDCAMSTGLQGRRSVGQSCEAHFVRKRLRFCVCLGYGANCFLLMLLFESVVNCTMKLSEVEAADDF